METLKNLIRGVKIRLVLLALLAIAAGALFVARPGTSGTMICYMVGAVLCIFGLTRLVSYWLTERGDSFGSFGLVQGAALLLCGGYVLFRPEVLYGILTTACAIFLIVDGVMKLQYAADLHRMQARGWWSVLAVALLMIVLGSVILFNPFGTMVTLMTFLGAVLIADGVLDIAAILYVHIVSKRVKKALEEAMSAAEAVETDCEQQEDRS